jgi:hypothetical protein
MFMILTLIFFGLAMCAVIGLVFIALLRWLFATASHLHLRH